MLFFGFFHSARRQKYVLCTTERIEGILEEMQGEDMGWDGQHHNGGAGADGKVLGCAYIRII